jgi:hypothetical protein
VVLLKRARWFEDDLRATERGRAVLEDARAADAAAWQDYAEDFDLADDEAIEAFYFSSAAGRNRVVVGNRRFGEGGYIATGRRQARPAPAAPPPRRGARGKGAGKAGRSGEQAVVGGGSAGAGPSGAGAAIPIHTPNANGGRKALAASPTAAGDLFGCSPGAGGSGMMYGSSPSGTGRRARRNARRQAVQAGMDDC